MRRLNAVLFALFLALGTAGCKSGSDEGGGGGGGGGGEGPALAALTIEGLNLTIQAPTGATVRSIGETHMVSGQGLAVSVRVANDNLDAANPESGMQALSMYNPSNVETQTLEDGWAITFQNQGGAGTNYWAQVRRVIDGTSYWCETTASSAEQQQAALDACKSLAR